MTDRFVMCINSYISKYDLKVLDINKHNSTFLTSDNKIVLVVFDMNYYKTDYVRITDTTFNIRYDVLLICIKEHRQPTGLCIKSYYTMLLMSKQIMTDLVIEKHYTRFCQKYYHVPHYYKFKLNLLKRLSKIM